MKIRKPTIDEVKLITGMFKQASIRFPYHYLRFILVKTFNDRGMGSLFVYNLPKDIQVSPGVLTQYRYPDWDGVPVLVSLMKSASDNVYEIDIRKENYQPVIKLPDME